MEENYKNMTDLDIRGLEGLEIISNTKNGKTDDLKV
jgi:hypothetical protein